MRPARWILMLAALLLAALPAPGSAFTGAGSRARSGMRVVASFNQGQFPEGLAIDAQGRRYVSVTTWGATDKDPGTGRVVRVTAAGKKQPVGPVFKVGFGLLTGVAIGPDSAVYVAAATSQGPQAPGVWRIGPDGQAHRVLSLPAASFPNGLAFRQGRLYVSDSSLGKIWTVGPGGKTSTWSASTLLKPASANGFGANGIEFRGDLLYVAVTDRSSIVGIPVRSDGSAGPPANVARGKALKGADGIAFGANGWLYVATSSSNTLVRLSPSGSLQRIAGPAERLLYPTTPAFDAAHRSKVYLVSGDFFAKGTPRLLEVPIGAVSSARASAAAKPAAIPYGGRYEGNLWKSKLALEIAGADPKHPSGGVELRRAMKSKCGKIDGSHNPEISITRGNVTFRDTWAITGGKAEVYTLTGRFIDAGRSFQGTFRHAWTNKTAGKKCATSATFSAKLVRVDVLAPWDAGAYAGTMSGPGGQPVTFKVSYNPATRGGVISNLEWDVGPMQCDNADTMEHVSITSHISVSGTISPTGRFAFKFPGGSLDSAASGNVLRGKATGHLGYSEMVDADGTPDPVGKFICSPDGTPWQGEPPTFTARKVTTVKRQRRQFQTRRRPLSREV